MDGSHCILCALEASSYFLQWFDQRWPLQILLPLQLLSSRIVFVFFFKSFLTLFSAILCVVEFAPHHIFSQDFQSQEIPGQDTKAESSHSQWIQMKTGNKIRYTSKRRHWRRTKLGLQEASHRKCTHLYWVKAWLIWEDPDAGKDWGQGGEGDDRGWDGWMASLTQWTWVWMDSGS